ncbi:hypothetical protein ES703_110051 [subsurface metagenome]
MSGSDLLSIGIFLFIVVLIVVFFVFIGIRGAKKTKERYREYQKRFKNLADKFSLIYGEIQYRWVRLPIVSGSVGDFMINYGIKEIGDNKIHMIFWRNYLNEDFPVVGPAAISWVVNKRPIGGRNNLAFGIYFSSFVPNNLRIKKGDVDPAFEEKFQLAGESEEVVKRYLTDQIKTLLRRIIQPETSRLTFEILCYYDSQGIAYGQLKHHVIVRDASILDELVELAKLIMS